MGTSRSNRILEVLRSFPYGITAKEMALKLGADHRNVSSQLSKLSAYGLIKKSRAPEGCAAVYALELSPVAVTETRQYLTLPQ